MGYLGDRIRIPSKRQIKAWRELWSSIHTSPMPITKTPVWLREWYVKKLEERIARLERTPKTPSRARELKSSRKQLARLQGNRFDA